MLPTNALYTRKRESSAGRRFRTSVQPQQGSGPYYASNTIIVNIPTAPNQLLIPTESTLNFSISGYNYTGNTMKYLRWDSCGAHGIISRLRLYHGSNLLEDIAEYGQLAKILFDYQVSQDCAAGRHSVMTGTRSDSYCLPQTADADFGGAFPTTNAALVAGVNRLAPVRYSNSGALIASSIANNGAWGSVNYSLNLVSLIGSLNSGKYFPLFACVSSPLRLELTLVSSINAACLCDQTLVNGANAAFQLSNVEFIGEFLELSDQGISTIMSGSDSPLQYVTTGFSNYQYTAALANNATTQVSIPVAAKYSSLKGLVTSIRNSAAGVSTANYYPFSSHPLSCNQVYWRVGSRVMPSKVLTTNVEFFTEALKMFGSLADQTYTPAIDLETYTLNAPVAGTNGEPDGTGAAGANYGSAGFVLGIDLEVFAGAEKDAFFQGLNTTTDDIFIVVQHSGAQGAVASCRYDTFAMFDRVIAFENGSAFTKF